MGRIFRYGVFGVGRIGAVHAAIVQDQGHEVIALGDEVPAAVERTRARLGRPAVPGFRRPEEMVQRLGSELDAVIVASRTEDHARHALPFVRAGIPVYLEKPLTDELEEAFGFIETIGAEPRLLQVGLQRRYDPALLHAKALLDAGTIGPVREIRCVLRDQYPPPDGYRSGGLIVDMGIHVADEAIFFLGEFPAEVWASLHRTKDYRSTVEEGGDTAFVTFTTPSGVLGRLDLSRTHSSGYNNETSIIGTEGTIHVGRFAGYPGPVPVEVWRPDGTLHPASSSFEMTHLSGDRPEFQPRFDVAYRQAHSRFREAIEAGAPFAVTQNEVLDAQVFVEAAERSAAGGGRRIRIERFSNLTRYRQACVAAGLIGGRGQPTG